MKICLIFSIIAVAFMCSGQAHNVTWGTFTYNDRLLARDFVQQGGSWMATISRNINFPPKGHFNNANLTVVRVWDWGGRKNASFTSLVSGGPGHRNATIHIKSQRGKGINCTVEYFGR